MTNPVELLSSALEERYAVERELGQGGMATVYLAQDLKHERKVAIKVLRPELSVSLGADRFLREIRVAANLQHPNILGLYDSGEANGLLYYVMPFIEGESLRDRLNREQQLPIHDALQITRESAEALAYAHEHGIVHRDIKPENILLQQGHALVADFGIARAVSEAGGEKLTQTGMAIGTPHYMSPEQSLGSEHVDARSDVYGLGCVLYELLVGQPPFVGPNAMAIMARHSMEIVPSLQVVRQSVPDEVEDAVMRALEKTPADRFQTMRDFAAALADAEVDAATQRTAARRAATASRRVPTRDIPVPESPASPRRKRLLTIGGGAAIMLLIAGGAWAALHRRPERMVASAAAGELDPANIAVLYFRDLGGGDSLGYLADGLTEGLIRELGRVQGLSVISANGVAPFRNDSIPQDSVVRSLKVGTLVQGNVEETGGRVRVTVRLVDGASGVDFQRSSFEMPGSNALAIQDSLTQQVAGLIRQRLGQEIKVRAERERTKSPDAWALLQRAGQHQKAAEALAIKGDTAGTSREFRQADTLLAAAEPLDAGWSDPAVARSMIAYRRARLSVEDPLQSGKWIEIGIGHAERALRLVPDNPQALEARGDLRYFKWLLNLVPDPSRARELLKSAREDLENAVRIAPAQASAWAMLSHLYYQTGDEIDVKLAARRAYEEDAYLSNADVVLSRLFFASYDLGQFPDAVHYCEVGQQRFPKDPKFVECRLWLMTTKARDPDVPLAWRLVDTLAQASAEGDREYQRLYAQMLVAGVLARAGLADSARHVAARSRGRPEIDPTRDLLYAEAIVRTTLGDKDEAIKALKSYLAVNPEKRAGMADDPGWYFRSLAEDPRFQKLVGGNP